MEEKDGIGWIGFMTVVLGVEVNWEDWIHTFTTPCGSEIWIREDLIHAFTTGYGSKIWN